MTNVAPTTNKAAPAAAANSPAKAATKADANTFARTAQAATSPVKPAVINGGPGNNDIKGTKGADTINGGKGADWINGGRGNDTINGGQGADIIKGGKGNGTINGGRGNDDIYGGRGNDTISGGKGNDTINGGKGSDWLSGGKGNGTINGGRGGDDIQGGRGNDTINGGKGKDWIEGGRGNDIINAGNGNDTIREGKGNDVINGGKGHDTVIYDGNHADYKISTNADGHTVVWSKAHGDDVLKNVETLKFNDKTVDLTPNQPINGTNGKDTINGGNGNDWIGGGNGNDTINGGNGNDVIAGGNGKDTINGGNGNDIIAGGNGKDTINGGNGNDWLFGGQGNDILNGGAGHDTAVFTGNHADYTIFSDKSANPSHFVVNKHTGERDVLKNIESVKFGDKTIQLGKPVLPPASTWSVSEVKDGKADIKLGDRYSIKLDEKNSVWTLTDHKDHSSTRIWGDPHVDIGNDGKNDFDFKKDATFQLEDGTKITVGTVPFGNTGQTMSSTLTITKGHDAIVVTGLGDKYDGASNLKVTQSYNGHVLDKTTDDGSFTLQEAGKGWTLDGQAVTQALVNQKEAH